MIGWSISAFGDRVTESAWFDHLLSLARLRDGRLRAQHWYFKGEIKSAGIGAATGPIIVGLFIKIKGGNILHSEYLLSYGKIAMMDLLD